MSNAGVIRENLRVQKLSGNAEFASIEVDRMHAGITPSALAMAAGMNVNHYYRLRTARRPHAATIARLRRALRALSGSVTDPGREAELVLASYRAFISGLAAHYEVTPDEVEAADPQRGATADETWRRCRQCAQAAIYLVVINFEIRQRRLAEILGLTPAAVCLACQAVEDRRDNAAFEAELVRVQRTITRRAA